MSDESVNLVFSTPASGPEPRALDLENAHLLAISRSGEGALGLGGRVANHLVVLGATLARSPLGGGAPREMLQNVRAADWAPNGTLAVAHYIGGRMRLEYPIGRTLYETSGWVSDLRFSPAKAFERLPVATSSGKNLRATKRPSSVSSAL